METPVKDLYTARRLAFLSSAEDYSHYATGITKKISKLKKKLRIHTRDTKKYQPKSSKDPRFGAILALLAERDSLHAQQATLKSRMPYAAAKLTTALKNSHKYLDFSTEASELDQYSLLETYAFVGLIEGQLLITKKQYSKAIYPLSVVRCILQCIHSTKEADDAYYEVIDSTIDPALKLALAQVYQLKPSSVASLAKENAASAANNQDNDNYLTKAVKIVKDINPAYITPSDDPETMLIDSITWAEYTAQVKNEDVALAIMKANDAQKEIVEHEPSTFDKALLEFEDAINFQEEQIERMGDNEDESQQEHIVLTYVKYHSILLKTRRDLTLLSDVSKDLKDSDSLPRQKVLTILRDSLKLIQGISLYTKQLKDLPGVANVDEIYESLNSLDLYFEVQKISNIAEGYLISNKYKEALALFAQAQETIQTVKPMATEFGGNLPTNESIEASKTHIESQLKKLYLLTSYFHGSNSSTKKEFVIDNIKKFPSGTNEEILQNIAPLKLDIQAVHVKPVLFDIAFNYLQYGEGQDNEIGQEPQQSKQQDQDVDMQDHSGSQQKQSGSFFGIFGRS